MVSQDPPVSPIEGILSQVNELRRAKARVIAAIDGRGGAGKSSLARALVSSLPLSAHIEHDWFHLPRDLIVGTHRFDHQRLISEVIIPFRSGTSKIEFLRYNWGYLAGSTDGFHDDPTTIEDKEILIIEGCETLHADLIPYLDLRIWLDTTAEQSIARGIRRDIEEYGLDPNRVHAAWSEWSIWEAEKLARDDRRKRADILV